MDLTMYQLRTFLEVAKAGSITKSSRNLGYSQSTVTAHVRSLELRVGAPLFDRLPHGVRLTEAGEVFRGYVSRILTIVDEMSSALQRKGEPEGRVSVGATATLIDSLMPALVSAARQRIPKVRLSPRVVASTEVAALVADGQLDIGLALGHARGEAASRSSEVSSLDLFPLDMVPASAGGVPLAREACIVTVDADCPSQALLARVVRQRYGKGTTVLETGSIASARELVLTGMGIAMLPVSAVHRAIDTGDLVVHEGLPRSRFVVRVLWRDQDWISPAVTAVLELIRRRGFETGRSIGDGWPGNTYITDASA